MKVYELNRKKYLELKKYDHAQMQEYLKRVFTSGYESGVKAALGKAVQDLSGLEEHLQGIRGIGAAKARYIADTVISFMEGDAHEPKKNNC